jgi:hypothetical protein
MAIDRLHHPLHSQSMATGHCSPNRTRNAGFYAVRLRMKSHEKKAPATSPGLDQKRQVAGSCKRPESGIGLPGA